MATTKKETKEPKEEKKTSKEEVIKDEAYFEKLEEKSKK